MIKNFRNISVIAVALWMLSGCSGSGDTAAEKGDGHNHGSDPSATEVELTQTQMKTADIRIGALQRRHMGESVRVNGEIMVNPSDMADVMPMVAGVVRRIAVVEGQSVNAGQPIAYIENVEVVQLQQEYLTALDEAALASKELARQESLSANGAGVEKNLQSARTASRVASLKVSGLATQLRQYGVNPAEASANKFATEIAVPAPISGTVVKIDAKMGAFADRSTLLCSMVNNAGVFARLNLFEKDLSKVKKGQHVTLRLTSRPEVEFSGVVSEINPMLDNATKSVSVRVKIDNRAGEILMPGMALTAAINLGDEEVDAVPEGAVATIAGHDFLFILEGEEKEPDGSTSYIFHREEVKTGVRVDGFVAVEFVNPVVPDVKVVIDNAFYLSSMIADHGEHNH